MDHCEELIPIGGHPAFEWVLREAIAAGIDEFVIVTTDHQPATEDSSAISRNDEPMLQP